MSSVRLLADLDRRELALLLPDALAVIPVGSTEQHGPHLGAGADATIAAEVAARAAEAARAPETIVLAPTLAYGASDHHLALGPTLSLRVETFQRALGDLLASAAASGARRVFVLNAHGGNTAACSVAVSEAARLHGIVCATALVSQLLDRAVVDAPLPGHAGRFETSLVLALAPHAARMEAARPSPGGAALATPRGLSVARPGRWRELDGFTDNPETASAELGEELLAECVRATAAAFEHVAEIDV